MFLVQDVATRDFVANVSDVSLSVGNRGWRKLVQDLVEDVEINDFATT